MLASPATAGAASDLMPGVTYERDRQLIGGRGVVLHVVRTPTDGGLYQLRPELSGGTVLGRQSVPSMQAALAGRSTAVGVNGDFFELATGKPSGVFLRDGVLHARANGHRSALAVRFDGTLLVDRFQHRGTWSGGASPTHPLGRLNGAFDVSSGVTLYTSAWGGRTPRRRGAVEAVLTGFPRTVLNGNLRGTVVQRKKGGNTWLGPGRAVLQARGNWRQTLLGEATRGSRVTVRLRMLGLPDGAADAIGGGPLLVRDGVPVRSAGEWFTLDQLLPRHPRTAVGQLANGRLIFVVADGRSSLSAGLTNWQMAKTMVRLGAQTAMGFDGGGSSTIAFNGRVLNRPSDGGPRAVAEGLFLHYYGIYAPPHATRVLTPNRDGVGERTFVRAKVVRPSVVDLRLVRPNGSVAWRQRKTVGRGWVGRDVGAPAMPNGTWRWVVQATDTATGRKSRMSRSFKVNKTLGHLRLAKQRLRVVKRKGGRLWISARLARPAKVTVTVGRAAGGARRVVFSGERGRGKHWWLWNGRSKAGPVVKSGTFAVRVQARNDLGTVALRDTVRVVRRPARS